MYCVKKIALMLSLIVITGSKMQAFGPGEAAFFGSRIVGGIATEKLIHHTSTPTAIVGIWAVNFAMGLAGGGINRALTSSGRQPIDIKYYPFGQCVYFLAALAAYYFEAEQTEEKKEEPVAQAGKKAAVA